MNKGELVAAMAEKTSMTKKKCEGALDAIVATIEDALKNGDSVHLVGFGTFEVKERAGRTGRNPRTNESIIIPPFRTAAFKPGKTLKDAVL